MQFRVPGFISGLTRDRGGEVGPAFVIHQRGRPGIPGDINLRAEGAGKPGGDFAHAGFHILLHFRAMGTQRAFQLDAFRQHVPGVTARNAGHAQHHRIQRVDVAAGDALQRRYQLARQHDGVVAFMRTCGVRAFTGNADHEAVDVGVERPAAGGELTNRQARLVVHTENRADIAQRTGPHHALRTAKVLFSRLKQDAHPAVKRGLPLFQL